MSKALMTSQTAIATLKGEGMMTALKAVLPPSMSVEKFIAIASAEIKSPALAKVTEPSSIVLSVYHAAKLGLSLNKHMGEAYLVPFSDYKSGKTLAQFIPGYKGVIKLARQAGVKDIQVTMVYEKDEFSWWEDETGTHYKLIPTMEAKPGKMVAVVTRAVLEDGTVSVLLSRRNKLDKIKDMAMKKTRGSGPWKDWEDEMYLKTAVKQHCKLLPQSEQTAMAFRQDDAFEGAPVDGEVPEELAGIIDADYTEVVEQVNAGASEEVATGKPEVSKVVPKTAQATTPTQPTPEPAPATAPEADGYIGYMQSLAEKLGMSSEQALDKLKFGIGKMCSSFAEVPVADRHKAQQYLEVLVKKAGK